MATINSQIKFTTLPDIQNRIRATVFSTALDVMVEASTVENHDKRKALAASIINNPDPFITRFTLAAATGPYSLVDDWEAAENPSSIPDASVEWVVGQLWDIMAEAMAVQTSATPVAVTMPEPVAPLAVTATGDFNPQPGAVIPPTT